MAGLSPDIIINLAFGSVMVLIGLAGIWIVKWSTDRMIRAQEHAVSDEENLVMTPARSNTMEEMPIDSSSATLTLDQDPLSMEIYKVTAVEHSEGTEVGGLEIFRSKSW